MNVQNLVVICLMEWNREVIVSERQGWKVTENMELAKPEPYENKTIFLLNKSSAFS